MYGRRVVYTGFSNSLKSLLDISRSSILVENLGNLNDAKLDDDNLNLVWKLYERLCL